MGDHTDADTLRELYHDRGLSLPEIGDKFDVDPSTVHYHMDKHDIPRRRRPNDKPPTPRVNNHGHVVLSFQEDGDSRTFPLHRLLATLKWEPEELADKDVHHANCIPWDNRLENLELKNRGDHIRGHAEGRERNPDGTFV